MGLTMNEQKGVAREMARRYRKASNKKKGQLIEEYMELTGWHHFGYLCGKRLAATLCCC